jgi:uncharacterized RDD family membrane protein YckC
MQGNKMSERKAQKRRQVDCGYCGFPNQGFETRCEKCGRPLLRETEKTGSGRTGLAGPGTSKKSAMPALVRREIRARVEEYQARRNGVPLPLPFEEMAADEPTNVITIPLFENSSRATEFRTPKRSSPPQPPVSQPTFYFDSRQEESESWQNVPVAPFRVRMMGLLRDAGWVLSGVACFLAPLPLIAGRVQWGWLLGGALTAGALLLTCVYGVLFICVDSRTPGMLAEGLSLVGFDGTRAPLHLRIARIAGTFVSAGSFFIGYLWAALDEEKLYWHDHISKTFLTIDR